MLNAPIQGGANSLPLVCATTVNAPNNGASVSEGEVREVLFMAWSSECCSLGARVAPNAQRFGVALAVHRQPNSVGSGQRRGGALAEWAWAWRVSRRRRP